MIAPRVSPQLTMVEVALELARIDNLGEQFAEAEARLTVLLEHLRPVVGCQPGQAAHYVHRRPTGDVLVVVAIDDDGDISAHTDPILSLAGVDWPSTSEPDDSLDGLDRALSDGFRSADPRVPPFGGPLPGGIRLCDGFRSVNPRIDPCSHEEDAQ